MPRSDRRNTMERQLDEHEEEVEQLRKQLRSSRDSYEEDRQKMLKNLRAREDQISDLQLTVKNLKKEKDRNQKAQGECEAAHARDVQGLQALITTTTNAKNVTITELRAQVAELQKALDDVNAHKAEAATAITALRASLMTLETAMNLPVELQADD